MKNAALSLFLCIALSACTTQQLQQTADAAKNAMNSAGAAGPAPLSNDEVIRGLKEALTVGTNNSSALASRLDGFYKNPGLFIPFPPEAMKIKEKVDALGLKDQTDKFVL